MYRMGSPSTDQIVITTALRGIIGLEVGLTGPRSDLHSGLHGGAVYNPIQALAELCASLHDADNAVTVEGFYEGVEQPTRGKIVFHGQEVTFKSPIAAREASPPSSSAEKLSINGDSSLPVAPGSSRATASTTMA